MRHFLHLDDLDGTALTEVLASARALQAEPRGDLLERRVLGLLFFNSSLRTLSSFQVAMAQMGGSCVVLTPGQGTWALEIRRGVVMDGPAAEHMREAIPVLEQYVDALGVRCFAGGVGLADDLSEPVLSAIADASRGPLINLESAMDHPCQALADWKTLDDLGIPTKGGRLVLSWAWHPKALPLAVPSAVLTMASRRGMDVTVLRPEGFGLPPEVMEGARGWAAKTGGSVRESTDRREAVDGAHVIYAKSWQAPSCYGDTEAESRLRAGLRDWCVAESWFEPAAPGAVLMHCLPVRRNAVVREEVLEGPRSRVVQQAGNRLHVQKALLLRMILGKAIP